MGVSNSAEEEARARWSAFASSSADFILEKQIHNRRGRDFSSLAGMLTLLCMTKEGSVLRVEMIRVSFNMRKSNDILAEYKARPQCSVL